MAQRVNDELLQAIRGHNFAFAGGTAGPLLIEVWIACFAQ